jgi:hypothetical protein
MSTVIQPSRFLSKLKEATGIELAVDADMVARLKLVEETPADTRPTLTAAQREVLRKRAHAAMLELCRVVCEVEGVPNPTCSMPTYSVEIISDIANVLTRTRDLIG